MPKADTKLTKGTTRELLIALQEALDREMMLADNSLERAVLVRVANALHFTLARLD
jgi:hypothetical protein